MKRRDMFRIIEDKYKRYTANVIEQIKALPPESRTSGDDSLRGFSGICAGSQSNGERLENGSMEH